MRDFFKCSVVAGAAAMLLLVGCSHSVKPSTNPEAIAAKPAAPPEPVTAKTAFWPMYKSALVWSSDAEVLHLIPREVPGYKNEAGKAAMWEAAFASPSKHQFRIYTYAIATVPPEVHKGIGTGLPLPWGGETRDVMPVDLSLFTVDSDAAYQTSSADATAWLAKNPGKQLTSLELGSTYKFQSPVWYVQWGDKKAGYIALVDAASGKVYKSR